MKRLIRIIFWGTFLLVGGAALLIAALFMVQPRRYTDFVEQQLVSAAQQSKIGLRIGGTELSPLAFRAYNVQMLLPKMLFPIQADTFEIYPNFFSLLSSAPSVSMSGALYGGSARGKLRYLTGSKRAEIQFGFENIQLASLPPLAGVGIRSGTLEASVPQLSIGAASSPTGEFVLKLISVEKPQPSSFALANFNLPFNVELPAFSALNSELELSLEGSELLLKDWRLTSSLGNARCTGRADLDTNGRFRGWSIDGAVELSEEGLRVFGIYLPLLSNQVLDTSAQRFRVTAHGSAGGLPEAKFSRM